MTGPLAVLVNGLPGAGKTTLARTLARHLGLPLFSKDVIKEAHADVLGTKGPTRRNDAGMPHSAPRPARRCGHCWRTHLLVRSLNPAGRLSSVTLSCGA